MRWKSLSMSVEQGEIIALLGSSGCGKTSTLRMLAGFEAVSRGRIHLAGREIHTLAPVKRNVAMAFEGYSLYPPLTVRDNIAFALKSSSLPASEVARRVEEVATMLEIHDILDRYPSSISGGQQQRASLARALVRAADLHLLDEPMGQLEPQLRTLLRGRLKHFIKERGLTAILVTHDQTEANALADRIAVMEEGELLQYGAPDEIKARPADLFTGTFIGEPPMNVLPADVSLHDDRLHFRLHNDTGGGATQAIDDDPAEETSVIELDYAADAFSREVREAIVGRGEIVIGVRPYAVRRAEEGARAKVIANQWLGDQTHIAARFAGTTLVLVEHDRTELQVDEEIGIALSPDDLHIFDARTGAAVSHGRMLA